MAFAAGAAVAAGRSGADNAEDGTTWADDEWLDVVDGAPVDAQHALIMDADDTSGYRNDATVDSGAVD